MATSVWPHPKPSAPPEFQGALVRGIRTPEDIQTLVSDRVHMIREVKENDLEIGVPLPQRTAPDPEGCNWTMSVFGNAYGHEDAVAQEVAQARAEVNLSPQ